MQTIAADHGADALGTLLEELGEGAELDVAFRRSTGRSFVSFERRLLDALQRDFGAYRAGSGDDRAPTI